MNKENAIKNKHFLAISASFLMFFGAMGFELSEAASSPTLSFTVDPGAIISGETAVLTWFGTNITGCGGYSDWSESFYASNQIVAGTWEVRPSNTSTYGLSCFGDGGTIRREVTLTVGAQSSPSYVYPAVGSTSGGSVSPNPTGYAFTAGCAASKTNVVIGEKVTFVGSYVGGSSGQAAYTWSGDVSGSGKIFDYVFSNSGTKTAKLTVTDTAGQSAIASCAVNVNDANSKSETVSGGNVLGAVAEKIKESVTPKTDEEKSENENCVCSAKDGNTNLFDAQTAAVGRAQSFVLWFVVALVIVNFGFLFYIAGRLSKLEKKHDTEVPV